MYAIQATFTHTGPEPKGWSGTRQIPTFYLHEAVQGIVNEDHAERIAREIIDPLGEHEVHVHVMRVDEPTSPFPRVQTWANGFGVWHARVPRHCISPLITARRALCDELLQRDQNVRRDIWMHPERVEELDGEDTIVYRENTSDGPR